MNLYEVSTKHPITGEAWDLHMVAAPNAEALESMPLFNSLVLKQTTLGDNVDLTGLIVWDGNEFLGMSTDFWPQLVAANAI